MADYYYLVSSLPTLSADSGMPFSYDDFVGMCKNTVSKKVLSDMENLTLHSENGAFLKKWGSFYNKLQKAVNSERRKRLGKTDTQNADHDFYIDKIASEAFAAKNPLEAEKILLQAEFDYLDSLTGMHSFDDYVLYGYAIKLKLLERQTVFTQKAGREEFMRLFEGIQKEINAK